MAQTQQSNLDLGGTSRIVGAPTPSATDELVNKAYADALGTTGLTPNTIMRRNFTGRAQVQDPTTAFEVANKQYVDSVAGGTTYQIFTPIGVPVPLLTDTIPADFIELDGTNVSRTTYADLFTAYGTKYGAGDGSTTFGLPNLKGRTFVGIDSTDTTMDATGETGGTKTETLTTAQMPSHNHGPNVLNYFGMWSANTIRGLVSTGSGTRNGLSATAVTDTDITAVTGSTGGGGAHNNMPPYMVARWITRYQTLSLAPAGTTASVTATPSTVALRDSAGRTQAVAGVASADVVVKSQLDSGLALKVGSIVRTLYTAGANYTPPANLLFAEVEVQAGGGGGGGVAGGTASTHSGTGGSGSGGTYARSLLSAATIIAALSGGVIPITVGAGGTAGAAGANNGGNGGNSSFGSLVTASGGIAGSGGNGASPSNSLYRSPATFTLPTGTGQVVVPGSWAGPKLALTGGAQLSSPPGGSSFLGPGEVGIAVAPTQSIAGAAPSAGYGGGGSGAASLALSTTARAGGAGAPGVVIVTEYLSA